MDGTRAAWLRARDTMPLETWFPTVVFYEDIALDPAVKHGVLEAVQERASGQAVAEKGYVTADNAVNDLHLDPRLTPLFAAFQAPLHQFLFELLRCDPERVQFYVGRCWPVVQVDNGFAGRIHVHGGAAFSAVFYLQVPEGAGALEFIKPVESLYDSIPKTGLTGVTYRTAVYQAVENRLIVFSSDLRHRRAANRSLTAAGAGDALERIAIAFDLFTVADIRASDAGLPRFEFLKKLF